MDSFRLLILMLFFTTACKNAPSPAGNLNNSPSTNQRLSPDKRFGDLFREVQMNSVFKDSKTFADCTPKFSADKILSEYDLQKTKAGFDLKQFVLTYFELPKNFASHFQSDTSLSVSEHINELWDVLTRQADTLDNGSLIPLPHPYIVPGGRFGEIYYWDSYFTMLGLKASGRWDMIEHMANNFAFLIHTIGFIPNGNRTYFLSRSQPPFFSLIVRLLAEEKGSELFVTYLPALEKEYAFWMAGADQLSEDDPSYKRVVRLEDGSILNRYWDDEPLPRPESYKEDVELVKDLDRPKEQVWRDVRAACESGWDFSSRWFKDGQYLASIHTTEIIPVDQNALLFHLEKTIADAQAASGDSLQAQLFLKKAESRKQAILKYCWDANTSFFVDYNFVQRKPTSIPSLAAMYPLFFEIADSAQARSVAVKIEKDFLKEGGLLTTLNATGQQWDAPNGWAPLQWMSIQGLRNYKHTALADTIAARWVALNNRVYKNTGKMVEKYNVTDISLEAGGGEYPVQDGFGWTNGVLLQLLNANQAVIAD